MNFDNIKHRLYQKAAEKRDMETKFANLTHDAYLEGVDDALEAVEREIQEEGAAGKLG